MATAIAHANPLEFQEHLQRPGDANYQAYKQAKVRELLQYPEAELRKMLRIQQQKRGPVDPTPDGALTKELLAGLHTSATAQAAAPVNDVLTKNLLGTASGGGLSDGSSLIRQDLETIVEA